MSPHFYTYLKLVHKKYGDRQEINGFALQGKSVRHSDGACCLNVPLENKLFLYPTLGTSGFSPNNKNWLHFHIWLAYAILDKLDVVPLIENNIAVSWYKSLKRRGKADSMWEMEYLFYTQIHQEFTLYPNFPGKHPYFTWHKMLGWTIVISYLPYVRRSAPCPHFFKQHLHLHHMTICIQKRPFCDSLLFTCVTCIIILLNVVLWNTYTCIGKDKYILVQKLWYFYAVDL